MDMDHRLLGCLVICFCSEEVYGQCMALGSVICFDVAYYIYVRGSRPEGEKIQFQLV